MTVVNTADPNVSLASLLALVRRGESVLLLEGGEPLAQIEPTGTSSAEEDDEGEAWWRGTYAPAIPYRTLDTVGQPVVSLPSEPIILERKPIEPNLNWLRPHGDTDE